MIQNPVRLFAVIPAAGHSRRMGRDKLLLPVEGQTVIARILDVLQSPHIAQRIVVIRPGDEALRSAVEAANGIALVPPKPPAEMRQSVEFALRWLEENSRPGSDDGWLLAPADHPLLDSHVLTQLVTHWETRRNSILIPTCGGRRGHPVIFPWILAREVGTLPPDVGLNQLVRRHAGSVVELEIGVPAILTDLDTPEDYAQLLASLRRAGEPRLGVHEDALPPDIRQKP
jgi:molybdenum cofactor cytidylyltransferase